MLGISGFDPTPKSRNPEIPKSPQEAMIALNRDEPPAFEADTTCACRARREIGAALRRDLIDCLVVTIGNIKIRLVEPAEIDFGFDSMPWPLTPNP